MDERDRALGAMLGAAVGDAAGGVLEFWRGKMTFEDVAHAMSMPGGGVFRLAPGQVTDDGELMLSLGRGLALASKRFGVENIARQYKRWIRSGPFDMGGTTQATIGTGGTSDAMKLLAYECYDSLSNGCLMRAAPLGVHRRGLTEAERAHWASEDCSLSHANTTARNAVACYALAISSLIDDPDVKKAWRTVERFLKLQPGSDWVRAWLKDAKKGIVPPCSIQIGFMKIGFVHAFAHLWAGTSFEGAIAAMLIGGGDTDTNACIVGGLLGARWVAAAIPVEMSRPVLECDTKLGRPRPAWLSTGQIPKLVDKLMKAH